MVDVGRCRGAGAADVSWVADAFASCGVGGNLLFRKCCSCSSQVAITAVSLDGVSGMLDCIPVVLWPEEAGLVKNRTLDQGNVLVDCCFGTCVCNRSVPLVIVAASEHSRSKRALFA